MNLPVLVLWLACAVTLGQGQDQDGGGGKVKVELRRDETRKTGWLLDGKPWPSMEALGAAASERLAAYAGSAVLTIDVDGMVSCGEVLSVLRLCKVAATDVEFDWTAKAEQLDLDRHVRVVPRADPGSPTEPFALEVRHRALDTAVCAASSEPGSTRTCERLEHWEIAAASRRVFSPADRQRVRTILGDEAASERDPAEPVFSNREVVIRADAPAPWLFARALIEECMGVGIYRVDLAQRERGGAAPPDPERRPGVRPLVTGYAPGQKLRVTSRTEIDVATSASNAAGRPGEARHEAMERNTAWLREVVLDEVFAVADGAPIVVRRSFETLDGGWTRRAGADESQGTIDSPLQAVALEIDARQEPVRAQRLGASPELTLVHQAPGLDLDALLPPYEVALGEPWPFHDPQVARALGTDAWLELFPELASDEWRRHPDLGSLTTLAGARWEGQAKLVALDRMVGDSTCAEIGFFLVDQGQIANSDDPAWRAVRDATFRYRLEGQMWFAKELQRPVALEARGTVLVEFDRELQGNVAHMRLDGTIHVRVDVASAN